MIAVISRFSVPGLSSRLRAHPRPQGRCCKCGRGQTRGNRELVRMLLAGLGLHHAWPRNDNGVDDIVDLLQAVNEAGMEFRSS
jgi:hypothetical protein